MGARLALGLLCCALAYPASADRTTITVLPFTADADERRTWLGTGIADILIRNLAEIERFIVLDRTRLQTYIDEMELQASALTNAGEALRVARVAKVDQIMFGSFDVTGDEVKLSAFVVALDTQKIVQQISKAGSPERLHDFLAEVTFDLAHGRGIELHAGARETIKSRPTDSLTATEQFYRAMEAQDTGEYEQAVSRLISATIADPDYREAHLWVGRMFEFMNLKPLALAAFKNVVKKHLRSTEGKDALLFGAALSAADARALALRNLELLVEAVPSTAHSVEAAFRLGELREVNDAPLAAYRAYGKVIDFRERFEDVRRRHKQRQSRFFSWTQVLNRHREAAIRRVSLYPGLIQGSSTGESIEPPRGVITVGADGTPFVEKKYGHTQPLFMNEDPLPNWTERFYAVIAPPGQTITGVDLQIRGQLTERSSHHDFTMRVSPFPIPRNYHNSWLGVIYGQADKPTRLAKAIPFYGNQQRVLTLQFIENHSRIYNWGIKLRLQPLDTGSSLATSSQVADPGGAHEGQIVSQVTLAEDAFSGVAKSLAAHWHEPRQTLALADNHTRGLYLVVVKGDLDSGQTDLWMTQSVDAKNWLPLTRMSVNSSSHDFSPRLVRAEDGFLRLFWISNRRGLGWELWTSRLDAELRTWAPANRVPLEKFDGASPGSSAQATELLHYAVTQDRRGRWLLAVRQTTQKRLAILASNDAQNWQLAGSVAAPFKLFNPAIIEDGGGTYRVLAFGATQKLHLWSTNDFARWRSASHQVNRYGNDGQVAPHPIHLFRGEESRLVALISDTNFGLQYAAFHPDAEAPVFDLVRGVGLEAYTASGYRDGFIVAQRQNDVVNIRRFRDFQMHGEAGRPERGIIYSEYSTDDRNNAWRRIFARMRVIQPDVTTVGVGRDERVWWGIETGAMTLKADDFFAVDVADGFFHHHVTTIEPCGAVTAFSSRDLDRPRIGVARRSDGRYRFSKRDFKKASGRINALICTGDGAIVVGTSGGEVLSVSGDRSNLMHRFEDAAVTALAASPMAGPILIGTSAGKLFQYDGELKPLALPDVAKGAIKAVAVDVSGQIWLSVEAHGVFVGHGRNWRPLARDSAALYRNVGSIRPDPNKGVWMIAADDEPSRGVLYSDGVRHVMLRPPDHSLRGPTGLAVAPSGAVWIGTAFDGLFELRRAPL